MTQSRWIQKFISLLFFLFACSALWVGSVSAKETNSDLTEVKKLEFSTKNSYSNGFYYSHEMLFTNACDFSSDLAKASMGLSSATYEEEIIHEVLKTMGYDQFVGNTVSYSRATTLNDNDYVAYTIAAKRITVNGEEYTLYCVPVRGTEAGEWYSDFNLGTSGNHEGFFLAAEEIENNLCTLFASDGMDSTHRIVWTTGHSRGAAVANILAAYVMEKGYAQQKHVFGYTFACPAVSKSANTSLRNIYNYNIPGDVVPTLPLEEWGYKRNGRDMDFFYESNFRQRYEADFDKEYAGASQTRDYIAILNEIILNEEDYHSQSNQLLTLLIAYVLGGREVTNIYELIIKAGFTYSDEAINLLIKEVATYSGILPVYEGFQSLIEEMDTISVFANSGLEETRSMTDEEFTQWIWENRSDVNKIENKTRMNIESRQDLINAVAAMRTNSSVILKIMKVFENVVDLMIDTDGKVVSALSDAHECKTYVYWINSMYYGYKGWYGNNELSTVDFSGINSIGEACFEYCSSLSRLMNLDTVHIIGDSAFSGLSGITYAGQFANDINYVGSQAFKYCSNMVGEIHRISGKIGSSAFVDCGSLTGELEIGGKIETVSDSAFRSTGIQKLKIENGVKKIEAEAFAGCSKITKLIMPISTEYDERLWYVSFAGCTAIETIIYTPGNGEAFYDSDKITAGMPTHIAADTLKKVIIEEGVKTIPQYLFEDCINIETIQLPSTLKEIKACAFQNCSNWKGEIQLPGNLKEIGESAFFGCSSLTGSVVIPESITAISEKAFYGCSGLNGTITLSKGLENIGEYAFYGCTGLTGELVIGGKLTTIPYCAFKNTGIQKLRIENGITTIGESSFMQSEFLEEVEIADSVEDIYYSAFEGCTRLRNIVFLSETVSIADSSFSSESSDLLFWGKKGSTAEAYAAAHQIAFAYLDKGTETESETAPGTEAGPEAIPGTETESETAPGTEAGPEAIPGTETGSETVPGTETEATEKVPVANTVLTIDDIDFTVKEQGKAVEYSMYLGNASEIIIPDTVTIDAVNYSIISISDHAFKDNTRITDVKIGSNIETIGAEAFSGCSKLKNVAIGSNVSIIGNNAFYKCTALNAITLPAVVKSIGKKAFYGCKNLKKISVKTKKLSTKSVGAAAFKGIHSNAVLKVPKNKMKTYKQIFRKAGIKGKRQKIRK